MKTSILALIALTTVIAAIGLYNIPKEQPSNDDIPFSYCNPGGTPTIFKLTSVTSLLPIKRNKNTFVFVGDVLQSVFLKKLHVTAKISVFSKDFDKDLNYQTVVGPLNDKLDVDLSSVPTTGTVYLTLQYSNAAGAVVDCQNLKVNVH